MYAKLAVRNVRRSAKDYMAYFVTIMLTAAIMFAFNTLIFSKDIMSISTSMNTFRDGVIFISAVMVLVVSMLISYTTSFILKKRKREFATYLMLGMSRRAVSWMFLLENIVIGFLSLVVGIGVGTLLYQVFAAIIMGMFDSAYRVTLAFSWQAILLTLTYFVVIYFVALLRARRYLKKSRIYDLMYSGRHNEKAFIKSSRSRVLLSVFSVLLMLAGIAGVWLFIRLSQTQRSVSALLLFAFFILIIIGIFGTYLGISSLLSAMMDKNKKFKYKGTNLFLARQVTAKINSNGILMGSIALMLTLTFMGVSIVKTISDQNADAVHRRTPFDITVLSGNSGIVYSDTHDFIEENLKVNDMLDCSVYQTGQGGVNRLFEGYDIGMFGSVDLCVKLSDYNRMRKMLGYGPASLGEDGYLVHINDSMAAAHAEKLIPAGYGITIAGRTQTFAGRTQTFEGLYSEAIGSSLYYETVLLVVPDSFTFDEAYWRLLLVDTEGEVPEAFAGMLSTFLSRYDLPDLPYSGPSAYVRSNLINSDRSLGAMLMFGAFYIGIVFIFMSAAILAIQQLSDSAEHRERFEILRKLGVEEGEISKLVFKQLAVYFILPVVVPLFLSLAGSTLMAVVMAKYVMPAQFFINFGITFGVFAVLYLCYFAVTYFGFRRNVSSLR